MRRVAQRDYTGILSELGRVDWNFPRAGTWTSALHSLHWFPGNFIPQIPSYLIQLLSTEGNIVCDPFCGSCTSGVEAALLNRVGWMSDFSPVSDLISRAKLVLLTDKAVRAALSDLEFPLLLTGSTLPPYRGDNVDELSKWFHPDTLDQLARIWHFIVDCADQRIREPLSMLFSDTLFACASTLRSLTATGKPRRHHWGWVADNVYPKPPVWHNSLKYFKDRLHRAKLITSRLPMCTTTFMVQTEDARSLGYDSDSVDLVVTSPPYLGMIDYTTASRLTYLWYGWDIARDRALEIGARSRRNQRGEPQRYLREMEEVVVQIRRVLKPGGFCAIVIGSSRKYPEIAQGVVDIFTKHMELFWGPKGRIPTRRRISDRRGTSAAEYVCVLRKV